MAGAVVTTGTVYERSGAALLARLVNHDGANVTQASLTTITYEIWELFSDKAPGQVVSSTSATIATVIFDTLQTDSRWTKDTTGYNFLHALPASSFPSRVDSAHYRIEYLFTPATGEVFRLPFEVQTFQIYSTV